jgi:hypothetical protein
MSIARGLLIAVASAAAALGTFSAAAMAGDAALTGQVTSMEEGAMEGVVVSAKKGGQARAWPLRTDDPRRRL